MAQYDNLKLGLLAGALALTAAVDVDAQNRPRMRQHTATEAEALSLVKANQSISRNQVQISENGGQRTVKSNGVPDHDVGSFPNRGNPHEITAQSYRFSMDADPVKGSATTVARGYLVGVAVNGVPFDPGAAEYWQGNPRSGWQYEALGGAVALGLDTNYAHVQPTGAYHYHGMPVGLMQELGWASSEASPLIGYAADGFPIYAITAEVNGAVAEMTSSYRLKSGNRPGGDQPDGAYDGAFVQDYTYVDGAGTLDECNGAIVTTEEYPEGTYAYFLTQSYPVIPRCLMGDIDTSFNKRG